MPEINSRKFVQVLQGALSQGGRLSQTDVGALESASATIKNATERAAAQGILAMLRGDRELDSFEVAPVKKALGVLLGVSKGPLPADLAKVLTHAVPRANVNVKEYDLTFDLSKEAPAFPARARITLDAAAPATAILEANPERLAISSVKVDGKDVPFELKDGRLLVSAKGATALDIAYTVKPVDKNAVDAYGLIRDKYTGRMWTLTWPYNTGALFPSNSAPADGATSKVTVKVADSQEAAGTGDTHGNSFRLDQPVPAYALAFYTAKKFEKGTPGTSSDGVQVAGLGLDNRAPADVREHYRQYAKESLEFYSQWLGKYEFGHELKVVEVEGQLGGMEHAGAVAVMIGAARDPEESKETAAHETAHHWFGDNLRIKSWGDFWMSEGFTNYATYRFLEHKEGARKFLSLWDRAKDSVQSNLEQNPHALFAPPNTDVNEIFDSIPYDMGAWMLRMMEGQLGREPFDALLKDWYTQHKGQAVSTQDFTAFAKAKTGKDFAPFFAAWNNLTAVPSFKGRVQVEEGHVTVKLTAHTPFPKGLTIPLVLQGPGGQCATVQVDPRKPQTFDVPFKAVGFTWDPERTVLATVA